mgnify:FL=1
MKGVSMVSPINQSKKVKNYSVDGFKWKLRKLITFHILVNALLMLLYLYYYFEKGSIRFSLILMVLFCSSIFLVFCQKTYSTFTKVVEENMDISIAKQSVEYRWPKYSRWIEKVAICRQIDLLRINFLLGDFREAYEYISTVNKKRYRIDLNFKWFTDYLFYDYLTRVHSGNNPNVSEYIEMLSSIKMNHKNKKLYITRHIDFMKAINLIIVEKQPVDNMGELLVANNLDRLMFNYYAALNCLNQNQHEEAKACFREIANENPDLFYVKEAKKYLEELA